ncbi:hypothetical protein [Nostoc sp. ChiSLP03a]|uniref:hypothetical protein n=1 Tax=Nostoc sp. ChiSLP03a TaxID=3075380 RepID=UPI002AD31782|nr:hypothetical protein [Nostoc sp. ChiSLP03a]MDZ8215099.1 hypothetical protein [Nostoc sp. ChiSLP03a]
MYTQVFSSCCVTSGGLIFASSYLSDRIIELPNRYETVACSGITTLCGSIATFRIRRLPLLPVSNLSHI